MSLTGFAAGNRLIAGTEGNFTTEDFSVSFWSYQTTLDNAVYIFKGVFNVSGWFVQGSSNGVMNFWTCQAAASQQTNTSASVIAADTWNHVVITRSGSTAKIYVNGSDATAVSGTHVNPVSSSNNFQVGGYNTSSNPIQGRMAEVALWDSELTAANVTTLYNSGSGAPATDVGSPVAYWKILGDRTFAPSTLKGPSALSITGTLTQAAHPFSNPDGTQLTSETLDPVVDFGAVGDGSTDNAVAFQAMRDWMRASPDTEFTVNFPVPATRYDYTNNRWLFGVRKCTINATGSTFKNTSASASSGDLRPFNTHSIWDTVGDVAESATKTYTVGDTIASVASGATQVVLQAGGTYAVGDRVFLHGFNQQTDGFPPNLRFFEWNEITAVDGSTLTLRDPLTNAYEKDDWPDEANAVLGTNIGKARILNLDRDDFVYPETITINGGEWEAEGGGSDAFLISADTLTLNNVTGAGYVTPTENRVCTVSGGSFLGGEPDKACDYVRLSGTTMTEGVIEAAGVNTLLIDNCTVSDGIIRVAPRRCYIRNSDLTGTTALVFGIIQDKQAWPCQYMEVRNNSFTHDGVLDHLINNHQAGVQGFTVEGTTGTSIHMTTSHIQRITVGTYMWDQATPANNGLVTSLTHDGTKWIVAGDWGVTPTGTWEFFALQEVSACFNTVTGGAADVYRFPSVQNVAADCKRRIDNLPLLYSEDAMGLKLPFEHNVSVTPSNTNSVRADAIMVTASGDVAYETAAGEDGLIPGAEPGTIYPVDAIIIKVTGTTATGIRALW